MLEGAKVFACAAGQAVIYSPFVMHGASTPPHQLGTTARVIDEAFLAYVKMREQEGG